MEGKQEIITAYLNQNYYGNQTYGVKAAIRALLRQAVHGGERHARRGGHHRRPPTVAVQLRPGPQCRRGVRTSSSRTRSCPGGEQHADRPRGHQDRPAPEHGPGPARRGRSHPDHRGRVQRGRLPRSDGGAVILAPQVDPALAGAALRLGGPRRAGRASSAARTPMPPATPSTRRPSGHDDPGPDAPGARREVGQAGRPIVPHAQGSGGGRGEHLGFDEYPDWVRNLDRQERPQRRPRRRSTTRPASSSPTSARPTTTRRAGRDEFQPQYDVLGQGYRQPGSAFKPFNYAIGIDDETFTAGTMLMDSATDFGGGYTPIQRGQPRARPGPRPQRAAVLAEHPVGQGDGPSTGPITCSTGPRTSG